MGKLQRVAKPNDMKLSSLETYAPRKMPHQKPLLIQSSGSLSGSRASSRWEARDRRRNVKRGIPCRSRTTSCWQRKARRRRKSLTRAYPLFPPGEGALPVAVPAPVVVPPCPNCSGPILCKSIKNWFFCSWLRNILAPVYG